MHKEVIPNLLYILVKQDVIKRYKGTYLGLFWALLNPIIFLGIYTTVFGHVFNAKWGNKPDISNFDFSINLFCGLMVFNVLAEVIGRSPVIITGNAHFVKKNVFEISYLPLVCVFTALANFVCSFTIWFIFLSFLRGSVSLNLILIPFLVAPLVLTAIGLSYALSCLNVIFRDIEQFSGSVTTALLFISPIFYSKQMVPSELQIFILMNPLTSIIENLRNVMIWEEIPSIYELLSPIILGLIIAFFGFICFQRLSSRFQDLL